LGEPAQAASLARVLDDLVRRASVAGAALRTVLPAARPRLGGRRLARPAGLPNRRHDHDGFAHDTRAPHAQEARAYLVTDADVARTVAGAPRAGGGPISGGPIKSNPGGARRAARPAWRALEDEMEIEASHDGHAMSRSPSPSNGPTGPSPRMHGAPASCSHWKPASSWRASPRTWHPYSLSDRARKVRSASSKAPAAQGIPAGPRPGQCRRGGPLHRRGPIIAVTAAPRPELRHPRLVA
jgi:hypothetical protein